MQLLFLLSEEEAMTIN